MNWVKINTQKVNKEIVGVEEPYVIRNDMLYII
jgi:hypothetical protein